MGFILRFLKISTHRYVPSHKIGRLAATAIVAFGFATTFSATANAAPKPSVPSGASIFGEVDLTLPHAEAGNSLATKGATPCSNTYSAVTPLGFGWSGEYRWLACSYWGYSDTARKVYQWYVSPQSSGQVCSQAYGFRTDRTPFWTSSGCGEYAVASVLWGNVVAYPKMKFESLSGAAVPIYWN